MPDYSLGVEITGDSSKLNKAAQDAEKAIDDLKDNADDAKKSIGDVGDSADAAEKPLKDLGGAAEDAGKDAKDASKHFENLSSKLDGVASKAQRVSGLMMGTVASGFGAAALSGVKFNAQMEQYATSFEVFTKSAEKADEILADLQKRGAETPFEFTDLADATQKMMSFGFTADEALGYLDMLGNAAQGDAEKLATITTAFSRMTSRGKVTLEDLNMMIDVGFNPLQQAAEDTGMTMGELYDAISDGELDVATITNAMEKMTTGTGQYAGMMEKQSKTLNGMLSTLSDTVQMKVGTAFSGLTDRIKEALPMIIEFIEGLDVNSVLSGLVTLMGTLGGVFTAATAARGALALMNFMTLEGQLVSFSKAMSVKVIAPLSTLGTFASSTLLPIIAAFAGVVAAVVLVGTAITQLWNTSEEFRTAVTDMIANFSSIFTTLYANVLKPIFDNVIRAMDNVWTNGIQPLWNQFVNFIGAITVKLSELLNSVMPVVNYFIDTFGPIIVEVVNTVVTAFSNAVNYILTYFGNLFNSLAQIVAGIIDIFSGIIDFIVGIFTGDWSKAWDGVKKIFIGIWETLSGVVSGVWNNILNLFTNGGKIFSGVVNGIANVFKNIVNSLIQGINSVIAVPFNTINGILNWIKEISILGFQPFNGLWDYNPLPVPQIPYLLHGTDDWQGGFARINEGGRGELTYLPDGTQVIPHDISVVYAKEAARLNTSADDLDLSGLLDGMVIQIDNSVRVGDRTLRDDIADYTIRKMGNTYRATLATKGGGVR